MHLIPDDPRIVDAEQNGYPEADAVMCPVCGKACDTIYEDKYGDVCGCENCMMKHDAYEWAEENEEENQ